MQLLNNNEALELLSLHAFQTKVPKDGYEELVQQVVRYCEGNPLALEVLGSYMSQKRTMAAWKSELTSFGKDFHGDIDGVLRRSYYWLTDFEKELFLHIACFFVGEHLDYVVNILEPDYAAESKIKTLTKRCFLYVTPDKKNC
ncbi:disease resistance protein RUN1-like [Rutidosis leptorrhynchoides]|uniref:disease resistance protein RUN1-like n=1 Tax=Rutidosis leptorrhynchoides TaxID=125765 RepID=UPI003A990156